MVNRDRFIPIKQFIKAIFLIAVKYLKTSFM